MSDHAHKFDRALALRHANNMLRMLEAACDRIMVVGSIRRNKPLVSDIELLYIPKYTHERVGLFGDTEPVNLADAILDTCLTTGLLTKRPNVNGHTTWGKENKLATMNTTTLGWQANVLTAVGTTHIPLDLFATHEIAWWTQLVCRTGGKLNNQFLAGHAHTFNYDWHPYDGYFRNRATGACHYVTSEEENYTFLELDYPEPWNRL